MAFAPKPIREQVIVITGASSGIGLTTARMAAHAGASVLLVARIEGALQHIVEDLRASGANADYVAADVSRPEDHTRIAQVQFSALAALTPGSTELLWAQRVSSWRCPSRISVRFLR